MNERPTLLKPIGPESLANVDDFRLGNLFVRPSLLEIRAGDVCETLEPRVMQVLVTLAGANGMVVSRDELIRECWGGRIVGEDAINRCVARIRRIPELVGNKAFDIETIPRVGYRLIAAPVTCEPSPSFRTAPQQVEGGPVRDALEHAESPRVRSWRKIAALAGAAALVAAVAIVVGKLVEGHNQSPPAPLGRTAQIAAVLSFTPLDSGRNAQAFADEISTDIADTLGRTELSVISPALSFQFRGDAKARAARALHAGIVVDGDVKRAGDNVAVSVRVEDVASGLILLSQQIQRPVPQAADLPDQVATFIAGAVGSDFSMRALRTATNPSVRGQMLRALFQCPWRQDPLCAYEIARNLVRMAPESAMAQTMFAIETTNVLDRLPDREKLGAIATARSAAWTAIRLDPHFGDPYIALGVLAPDMAATEAYLRRGLSVDPDSTSLAGYLSGMLLETGRTTEAYAVIQKVAGRYAFLYFVPSRQTWVMLQRGQTDDALELAHHALKLWPERDLFGVLLLLSAMLQDNPAGLESLMNDPLTGPLLRDPLAAPTTEDIVHAFRSRRVSQIEKVSQDCGRVAAHDWSHEQICMTALFMLGRFDEVFRLPTVEGAARVLFFPQMRPLRADPRFLGLTEKLGLFSYWKKTQTRPDFCATEQAPVCQALGAKGS